MLKGMIIRMPTLVKAMLKGYLPTTIKGSLTTMPADFLVDKEGVIQEHITVTTKVTICHSNR